MWHRLFSTISALTISFTGLQVAALTPIEVSAANRKALGLETEAIRSVTSLDFVSATGRVIAPPATTQSISAPLDGVLLDSFIIPGQRVEKEQKIARVYSESYATKSSDLQRAQLDAKHNSHLMEQALQLQTIGLRSEAEVHEAEHEMKASQISVKALQNQLGKVKRASGIGQFYVHSEHSGVITQVAVQTGDEVKAFQPLLTVFTGDKYWANVSVPDTQIDRVHLGMSVAVSNSNSKLKGKVVAINPEISMETRAVEVMVELPATKSWRVGDIVTAKFVSEVQGGSYLVPSRSVVSMGGDSYIFKEVDNGFLPVKVTLEAPSGFMSLVSGSLSMGDEIAVSGLAALKNVAEGG